MPRLPFPAFLRASVVKIPGFPIPLSRSFPDQCYQYRSVVSLSRFSPRLREAVKEPFGSNPRGDGIRFAGTVELVLIKVSSFSFMLLSQPSCLWQKPLHSLHRNQDCSLLATQANPMLQIVRQTSP